MACSLYAAVVCAHFTLPTLYPHVSIEEYVTRTAVALEVPPELAHAIVSTESNYNPMATGTKGEIGLTQIRCTTAFTMGFAGDCNRLYDIGPNLVYGLAYLKSALRACGGDRACAISRYNKGIHARPSLHSPYVRKVKKNMKAEAWIK